MCQAVSLLIPLPLCLAIGCLIKHLHSSLRWRPLAASLTWQPVAIIATPWLLAVKCCHLVSIASREIFHDNIFHLCLWSKRRAILNVVMLIPSHQLAPDGFGNDVPSGFSRKQNHHFHHVRHVLSSMPTSLNLLISFSSLYHSNSVVSVFCSTHVAFSRHPDRVWNPLSQEDAWRSINFHYSVIYFSFSDQAASKSSPMGVPVILVDPHWLIL